MRDVFLVARFEVLRAIRTWRAVALLVLFAVASAGSTYLFVRFVGLIENNLADQLGVPRTRTPGAMMQQLIESDTWRDVVQSMVGAPELVDFVLSVPPLAMFNLWFGFLLVPFFAASASAECIALDVQSRAIRFEVLRTGRLELVVGRMAGQLVLAAGALLGSTVAAWAVGVGFMVVDAPVELGRWLAWFAWRAWVFAVPFVGIGVSASQLTSSPAWARVLAVGATALTWVAYGLARFWEEEGRFGLLTDLMLQLLPQGWLRGLWEPGFGWLGPATAACALGLAYAAGGYLRFARKDL